MNAFSTINYYTCLGNRLEDVLRDYGYSRIKLWDIKEKYVKRLDYDLVPSLELLQSVVQDYALDLLSKLFCID